MATIEWSNIDDPENWDLVDSQDIRHIIEAWPALLFFPELFNAALFAMTTHYIEARGGLDAGIEAFFAEEGTGTALAGAVHAMLHGVEDWGMVG